jgi:zinc transport system permease protein
MLNYDFMQHALFAGLLTSLVCGVIGSLVVVNRIVFLSGGIAHAAYGGIGLAFFMGWPYLVGVTGFSLTAAIIMALVTLNVRHRADTIIGVIWAVGMALGVIFLDLTPGYHPDLMSYLFGSILAVPRDDLYRMIVLGAGIIAVASYYYTDFLAMSYDSEFAGLRGIPVKGLYLLLVCMIAMSVVMTIRVVGLILVIALLTIPPYIAEQYVNSLAKMMILSTVLSMGFTVAGLFLSWRFNLTSGAAIIMIAGCGFFVSMLFKSLRSR